jgi:hypothetical protein
MGAMGGGESEAACGEAGWRGEVGELGFGAVELEPGVLVLHELGVLDEHGSEAEGVVVAFGGEVVVGESAGLIPVAGQVEGSDGEGVEEVFVTGKAVESRADLETGRRGDWGRRAEVERGGG